MALIKCQISRFQGFGALTYINVCYICGRFCVCLGNATATAGLPEASGNTGPAGGYSRGIGTFGHSSELHACGYQNIIQCITLAYVLYISLLKHSP